MRVSQIIACLPWLIASRSLVRNYLAGARDGSYCESDAGNSQ